MKYQNTNIIKKIINLIHTMKKQEKEPSVSVRIMRNIK